MVHTKLPEPKRINPEDWANQRYMPYPKIKPDTDHPFVALEQHRGVGRPPVEKTIAWKIEQVRLLLKMPLLDFARDVFGVTQAAYSRRLLDNNFGTKELARLEAATGAKATILLTLPDGTQF